MEKYAGTQAVARTFQLIKLFDDEHPEWSLGDLIEASGLKRTTVFRLMAALEAEGVIRKTENGEYALGPTMIVLGGRAIRANRLRVIAQPFLTKLVRSTGESATIDALWIDDQGHPFTIVIDERLSQRMLGLSQYIGARLPAHTTSTGHVMLAYKDEVARRQITWPPFVTPTNYTVRSLEMLQNALDQVKRQGFALTRNELEVGLAAVSAPIFNHHHEAIAALCVAGPTSRLVDSKLEAIIQAVQLTAAQISAELGCPHPIFEETPHE